MDAEVTFWPSGRSIKVRRGTTLLVAARRAGVLISSRCGGNAACFMCKVTLRPESELMPMADTERRKLAGLDANGIRLACQVRVAGKTEVEVPLDPLRAAVARQLALQKQNQNDDLW